jgi:hypothetical protein
MLELISPLILSATAGPEPEDVKAGWTALVIVLLMVAATVLLALSLGKQLRKAQAAKDAGAYGDPPASTDDSDPR